jgi:histone-lysine N-methyltransferase SETDB1
MEELHRYLRLTRSNKAVDLFDFDFWVHCYAEFVAEKGFTDIRVMSFSPVHITVPAVL